MEFPGEKLLIRLVDLLDFTIRGLVKPWQIERTINAETKSGLRRMMQHERARQNLQLVREGKASIDENGDLSAQESQNCKIPLTPESNSGLQELFLAVQAEANQSDLYRLANILQEFQWAKDAAQDVPDEEVSDEPVDPDWFARWRNWAQDVSTESMQVMWGRVLAGEAQKPGTYSLHTLDLLSRLSPQDAELISKAATMVIDNLIYRSIKLEKGRRNVIDLDAFGLSFLDCLMLGGIGIINEIGSIATHTLRKKGENRVFASQTKAVKVTCVDQMTTIKCEAYPLTLVGRELCKLSSQPTNECFLQEFASTLKGESVTVEVGDWQPIPDEPTRIKLINLVKV